MNVPCPQQHLQDDVSTPCVRQTELTDLVREAHMKVPVMRMCMRFLKIRRCPTRTLPSQFDTSIKKSLTFNAINRLSPSTYAKLRLTHPGYPLGSPFRMTCSTLLLIPLMSLCDNSVIQAWSLCDIKSAQNRIEI
jgi:hypothetical protein